MGSHHKKKKKTENVNVVIADIKDEQDQASTKAAIQPAFEGTNYMAPMRTMIDFVNVTETIDPSQTNAPTPPAQVTGLNVTVAGNNQLDLAWTASGSPGVVYYNIYRSLTTGTEVLITTSTVNSYSDVTVNSGTQYFYKVAAVNSYGMEGTLSAEASATTTGIQPPMLELHLDSNFVDTSPNAFAVYGDNTNGFILPGQFGIAGWKCNTPTAGFNALAPEQITDPYPTALRMDTTVGFSISLWVNPQDLSTIAFRRVIWEYALDANNKWSLQIEGGTAYFFVKKAGTDYKVQVSGFTTGSWQHVAATFNGATNTALIYRNAVVGTASVVTAQYPYVLSSPPQYQNIGYRVSAVPAPDGSGSSTLYVGYLDEMRWYKSIVLTSTQVTNLKNTNTP